MESSSPFLAMQRLETQIKMHLRTMDVDALEADEKKAVTHLRRLTIEARLDIRDYELSETRAEQLGNAIEAKNRLAKLQACILLASSAFNPADVAQLSAQLEHISSRLE